ncbi:MAG: hypothetical protein LAO08_09435 [Acidobacteriia bacterium]|nr:hypothetical protein [Terriglobia bacterium]
MKKFAIRTGWAALAVAGLALVVGAQGPPPGGIDRPGRGPGRLMDGSFEFGGLMGGFGGKTVTGKPFQATFTITHSETLPGNSIKNTITGTIARDADGSTYRDVKLPAIGPWAASGDAPELIYIRNLTKMEQYIENVAKKTYQVFAIREHNPPRGDLKRPDRGPKGPSAANESVSDTQTTYTDPMTSTVYKVDDRKVTRTIPKGQIGNEFDIVTTTERLYSPDLDLVLQVTRTDPRFGNSTYQLSNIGQPASSLFLPDPSFQLVQKHGEFRRGGPGGEGKQTPPPQD